MIMEGKYGKANIYASYIDNDTLSTIQNVLNQPFIENSEIAIMPDAHKASDYCLVGYVQKGGKIVPSMISADICCSVEVIGLGKVDIDFEKFDKAVREVNYNTDRSDAEFDFSGFRYLNDKSLNRKELERKALDSISTGNGNHFIELDKDEEGYVYLVIHSGSRNLGGQIYKYYQRLAEMNCVSKVRDIKKELIKRYKEEGREKEISKALESLPRPVTIKDLCYLEGEELEDYMHDVQLAATFAIYNKSYLASRILDRMNLSPLFSFDTFHNYIDEEGIIRKGAISAKKGETVYIPISMKEGGIIVKLKEDSKMLKSFPHGAGRVMSRSEAKSKVSLEDFKKEMEGIYSTSVNENTIDEAPLAYKKIDNILPFIEPYAESIIKVKPIYNFKEEEIPRK